MSFPSSPVNNQTATVNGITYSYNSTNNTWKRVPVSINGTITFNVVPPETGNTIGDIWIDSNDGTEYRYVSDGTSTQWINLTTPAFNLNNLSGGTTGSLPWQSASNTTSFLPIGSSGQVLTSTGSAPVWQEIVQTSVYANTGQLTANTATGVVALGLSTSGVTAGYYGSSSYIPGLTIDTYGRITSANNIAVTIPGTSSDVQYNSFGVGTAASGTTGEIRATSTITSYYSDDRLKTRLNNIENALDKVMSLNGFYYEANETAQALGYKVNREVGVSAQEVQNVLPEIVVSAPIDDKYLTVHYERVIPLLIEAIKEQQKQIEQLKSIINVNN